MNRKRRNGYVLLMALVVIALAGFLLASVARQSLLLALEAVEAERELQRKWGTLSLQRACLDNAQLIFERLEASRPDRLPRRTLEATSVSFTCYLGDLVFDVRLADEDAKINLNTVYRMRPDRQQLGQLVRQFSASPARRFASVALRPRSSQNGTAPPFDSWGQVFAANGGASPSEYASALIRSTEQLTCWSSGSLNVRRASDDAIEGLSRLVIGRSSAHHLMELRLENPDLELSVLLNRLGLLTQERKELEKLLSTDTSCYSVWVTANSPERSWHEFHVRARSQLRSSDEEVSTSEDDEGGMVTHRQFKW